VASFKKVRCIFYISKSPKKILQKTILNWKFKFQAQDSFLEYFYFGDLKNESLFLKKNTPLVRHSRLPCRNSKIIFVLGADKSLERLESKTRNEPIFLRFNLVK
jgi:hypothetical protein